MVSKPVYITAILACRNRRNQTLACLDSLFRQDLGSQDVRLAAVVVDDGSCDGTADAISERFPAVELLRGDGRLFWANAMAMAESAAITSRPDYLLWLNDDVVLDADAVRRLRAVAMMPGWSSAIVAGALQDGESGRLTYSGVRRVDWHPMRYELVPPGDEPAEADTFNGNVVLVPRDVYGSVGGIDGCFAHAMADFDYGLRARRLGFPVVVMPGRAGCCTRGSSPLARDGSIREQLRTLLSPKGLPPRSLARYLYRHGGALWPVFVASPYVKFGAKALGRVVQRRSGATWTP